MTAKRALAEKLLRDSAPDGVDRELASEREAWVDALEALMRQLQAWLGDPQFKDTLHVANEQIEIREEDLGAYAVPSLKVQSRTRHPREVHVLPRAMQVVGGVFSVQGGGRRLVGAHGRVDLVCGAARETLLRFVRDDGTSWRWGRREGELTEESFFEVLGELLG